MEARDKLIYLLKQPAFVILVGYFYIISTIQFGFNAYDSGIVLTGGMRILHGEIPYRDFFTMYAPGQFYLDAFLQLISREVIFIRFILSFFQLGILILISKISISLFDKKYYIYSVLMSALWLGGFDIYNRGIVISLFFVLLTILIILKNLENYNFKSNILIGFLISVITFFRHDIGFYAFLFFNIFLLINHFKNKRNSNYFKIILYQFIGFIPLIIYSIYLVYHTGIDIVYSDLIQIPSEVFPKYRSLPFPQPFEYYNTESFGIIRFLKSLLHSFCFYIPFLTLLLYIFKFIKYKDVKIQDLLLFLSIFIFINQLMIRSELEHATPAVIISSLLYFDLIGKLLNFRNALIIGFIIVLPNLLMKKVLFFNNILPNIAKSEITGLKNLYIGENRYNDINRSVNYIVSVTHNKERIFVGETTQNKAFLNEAAFYYLAERLPATRYHELHPGVTTIEKTHKEMVQDLEMNKVRYIILSNNSAFENNLVDDGKSLDEYIVNNYSIDKVFGKFTIMKRITSQ